MDDLAEINASDLQRLLGLSRQGLSELVAGKVIVRAQRRGRYLLVPSVSGYCAHLREQASARGGEAGVSARERLGQAQAALAEAKAAQLRSELVETDAVEKLWTLKLRAFRNRILGIPGRVQHLSARQTVVLQQELRAALAELADNGA